MGEKRERSRERTERREKTSEGETSDRCTRHKHTHAGVFMCYDDVTGEAHYITSHNSHMAGRQYFMFRHETDIRWQSHVKFS